MNILAIALIGIGGYAVWKLLNRPPAEQMTTCEGLTTALYIDGGLVPPALELCVGEHTVEVGVTNCTPDDLVFEHVSCDGIGTIASGVTVSSGQQESFFITVLMPEPTGVVEVSVVLKPSGQEPLVYPGVLLSVVECY